MMCHDRFTVDQVRPATLEAHPLTVRDLIATGRVLQPNRTIDVGVVVGRSYLENTGVFNEFWRPWRLERQLLAQLGDSAKPYGTICFARSYLERAFSARDILRADWVRVAAAAVSRRLETTAASDRVLQVLQATLDVSVAVFDGAGFLLWSSELLQRVWRTSIDSPNERSFERLREVAFRCAALRAPVFTVPGLRVSRTSSSSFGPYVVTTSAREAPRFDLARWSKRWGLTRRETDILELIAAGKTTKETAAELDRSPRTVEVHVSAILKKAGSCSCRELVARLLASSNSIS
jgi:DNA-binding CsgD family transcriptional regulator